MKKLRNHSHSIRCGAVLMLVGAVLLIPFAAQVIIEILRSESPAGPATAEIPFLLIPITAGILSAAAAVGMMKRSSWGRPVGMTASCVMMLSIPIGTLIGILLLIALIQEAPLFGPDRITHRAIEAEWKLRKQRKKAAA